MQSHALSLNTIAKLKVFVETQNSSQRVLWLSWFLHSLILQKHVLKNVTKIPSDRPVALVSRLRLEPGHRGAKEGPFASRPPLPRVSRLFPGLLPGWEAFWELPADTVLWEGSGHRPDSQGGSGCLGAKTPLSPPIPDDHLSQTSAFCPELEVGAFQGP